MKNIRYLQQTDRARIEHDLVLTRMGELMIRDDNLLVKGLLYPVNGLSAVIIDGLISSPGSGLSVDLSAPAFAIQAIDNGTFTNEVKYIVDDNSGIDFNIVLDTADPSNDRIDIIEARIEKRSAFTDLNVSIADPVTKVISSQTRDRDFELFLNVKKKTGTPAVSPVPPSPTSATSGQCLGTVDINSLPNNLSSEYILNLAVGIDAEFVEIDLRGSIPSATTAAEIIANINAAGFGTVASLSGNYLLIQAQGTGENSVVKIKQPLDPSIDAYEEILGYPENLAYNDIYEGANGYFKVAEIFVPTGATSLSVDNVRSREEKDTAWDADAGTIENVTSLDAHRKSDPMDHADESIYVNHLNPSVTDILGSKITLFRGAYAPIYFVSGDSTFRQGTLLLHDIEAVKVNGLPQDNFYDNEQQYPLNRVDQREEDYSSGSGYSVPVSLSELSADKRNFTVGALVNDGTSYYTTQNFAENHNRIGIYLTNGGSVTGFTHLRITLHDPGNTQEGQVDIPIADLQSVGTGWIYANMSAILTNAVTYHYHFEMIGETSPTPPVLGNQTGTGADTLAFREMYLPIGGKYGTINEDDVVVPLDNTGSRLSLTRNSGDDDIITPGDGFLGESTGSNYDLMIADFSNSTLWQNWRYEDYVGIDLDLGRLKISPSLNVRNLFVEFNIIEGIDEQDAKNVLRHSRTESTEESFVLLEEGFIKKEIVDAEADFSTSIYETTLDNTEALIFPNTGTPKVTFEFKARNNGIYHARNIFFELLFAMTASDTGVVKLDMAMRVNGISKTARTQTIDPPNDTSRTKIITSGLYLSATDFAEGDEVMIELTRDNTVGSNHSSGFGLFNLGVI